MSKYEEVKETLMAKSKTVTATKAVRLVVVKSSMKFQVQGSIGAFLG